jgi:ubiquinone/menaquinone biosynthesis C-methylase UbiE
VAATVQRTRKHANMYGLARHARGYDLVAGVLARPLYRRVVADVTDVGLPAGSVVLDVGTGPGRLARLIAAACPTVEVEGVDLSPEMIARATSTAVTTSARNVRFQVGDVVTLPFADGSVDLVVSTLSLHHWDDPAAGLDEIVRVLAPGGRAWIYDFRPALTPMQPIASGLDAGMVLESPLIGTSRLNPIARLVLRHRPPPASGSTGTRAR